MRRVKNQHPHYKFFNSKSCQTQEIITNVRNIRKSKNISSKQKISLYKKAKQGDAENNFDEVIIKLCNLEEFNLTDKKIDSAISFVVNQFEFFVPISSGIIDIAAESGRLLKDLEYHREFLNSVQKKLINERFIANAKPEVISIEKKKQADAEAKIQALEGQLAALKH